MRVMALFLCASLLTLGCGGGGDDENTDGAGTEFAGVPDAFNGESVPDVMVMPDVGWAPDAKEEDVGEVPPSDTEEEDTEEGGVEDVAEDVEEGGAEDTIEDVEEDAEEGGEQDVIEDVALDIEEDAGEEGGETPEEISWTSNVYVFTNHTDSSDFHVKDLILEAVDGLGFAGGDERAPQASDLFFAGRYYLVWIDQTGFVGKMNGLWRLNGESGDALNFSVRDGERPLNMLIVGEDGNGNFPAGYPGSEHIEFPNTTPEPNDIPSCAEGDWCNQYAHNEAASITDPDIPWWSSCNGGQVGWSAIFTPMVEEVIDGGIKLVWEAPLVKEADGDGTFDNDECHQNWLFPDGIRRTVYLRVGYEFFADEPHLDRTMQFFNPEGNPPFDGPMSLIGGFVLTRWPDPHPLKAFHRWMRPGTNGVVDSNSGIALEPGIWNFYDAPVASGDVVFAWLDQAFGLSAFPDEVPGQTAILSHVGPSDNADVGMCLCKVHGGIEMGGGLIHGGTSLPIDGGQISIEARRRLALPGDNTYPKVLTYDVIEDFSHGTGNAEDDGWAAATGFHDAGHMIYGPYTTDWCGFMGEASFSMMVDNNTADDFVVVSLEVYDFTTDQIIASRPITRTEFVAPFVYQTFSLPFDATGCADHVLELRVDWKDLSYVKVQAVSVTLMTQ